MTETYESFDVAPVIARIKTLVAGLRQVAGAGDYAAVRSLGDFPVPCSYVLLPRDKYQERDPGHGERGAQVSLVQKGSVSIGVILAVRNYREKQGAQLTDELRSFRDAIRRVLRGWIPDAPGARPLQLVAGNLSQYDASTALWTDVYSTQHMIGSPA